MTSGFDIGGLLGTARDVITFPSTAKDAFDGLREIGQPFTKPKLKGSDLLSVADDARKTYEHYKTFTDPTKSPHDRAKAGVDLAGDAAKFIARPLKALENMRLGRMAPEVAARTPHGTPIIDLAQLDVTFEGFTLGFGSPETGDRFNEALKRISEALQTLGQATDSTWHGPASRSYADRNSLHQARVNHLGEIDLKIIEIIQREAKQVSDTRDDLDQLGDILSIGAVFALILNAVPIVGPEESIAFQIGYVIPPLAMLRFYMLRMLMNATQNAAAIIQLKGEYAHVPISNPPPTPVCAPTDSTPGKDTPGKDDPNKKPDDKGQENPGKNPPGTDPHPSAPTSGAPTTGGPSSGSPSIGSPNSGGAPPSNKPSAPTSPTAPTKPTTPTSPMSGSPMGGMPSMPSMPGSSHGGGGGLPSMGGVPVGIGRGGSDGKDKDKDKDDKAKADDPDAKKDENDKDAEHKDGLEDKDAKKDENGEDPTKAQTADAEGAAGGPTSASSGSAPINVGQESVTEPTAAPQSPEPQPQPVSASLSSGPDDTDWQLSRREV